MYESVPCTSSTNRVCASCNGPCLNGYQYEALACTTSTNRVCQMCANTSRCTPGTYLTQPCTATTPNVCTVCPTTCAGGPAYLVANCTTTTDTVCSTCTLGSTYYGSVPGVLPTNIAGFAKFDLYVSGVWVGEGTTYNTTYSFGPTADMTQNVLGVDLVDMTNNASGFIGVFGTQPTRAVDWKCRAYPTDDVYGPYVFYSLLNNVTLQDAGSIVSGGGAMYTVTPYVSALQTELNGDTYFLGTFDSFVTVNGVFSYMLFSNGDYCWTVKKARSLKVFFVCGATFAMLPVSEPRTCHYEMTIELPQACNVSFVHNSAPVNWASDTFDDSSWAGASSFFIQRSVSDIPRNAQWLWSQDNINDHHVVCRYRAGQCITANCTCAACKVCGAETYASVPCSPVRNMQVG